MRPEGNASAPLRLVISGGIGSGKTTVLRILGTLGIQVIEADRIGHAVLEPDGAAFAEVAALWPGVVSEGRIDRPSLATIVFSDVEQLRRLESVTHPHIAAEIRNRVGALAEMDVAVEIPLDSDLLGAGWTRIVIDAPDADRGRRAVARGADPEDVSRRMTAQPDRDKWLAAAAVVVDNSGTIADLERNIEQMVVTLRAGG